MLTGNVPVCHITGEERDGFLPLPDIPCSPWVSQHIVLPLLPGIEGHRPPLQVNSQETTEPRDQSGWKDHTGSSGPFLAVEILE